MSDHPLRVVELSTGLAGGYCTKLLLDAGAEVVKVEPAGGDPLRQWSACHARPATQDGALFQYLAAGKSSRAGPPDGPPIAALLDGADVVVAGPEPVAAALRRQAESGAVVVNITPWGAGGPWADRPWSEFVLQAESGSIAGRGLPGGVPFQAGGRTVEWAAGAYAALAALAAARRARRTGHGEFVDVSMFEVATIVCGNYADLATRLMGVDPTRFPIASIETPSIEPTADGYVGFTTNARQQFDDFLVLIERPDLLGDDQLAAVHGRLRRLAEWTGVVHAWTRRHTTAEIIERAAELRIPVSPIGNGATVVEHEQFVARGTFVTNPSGGFRQPRRPYRFDFTEPPLPGSTASFGSSPAPDWPARTARAAPATGVLPLAGIRILDLTAWWAGPAASHALATFGAEVIHVEALTRLDGMRMVGGALMGRVDAWWEHSAYFLAINNNKLGITLDFTMPAGRAVLERLIANCDAVLENFTPRVLDNAGLTWPAIHALNPRTVLVRMPAFGLDGPWRDRPGFAQTMEQLTGLAWLTGHEADQPRIQRGPCDPIAGMHAALACIAALDERDRTGRGVHVEATMAEAALNIAAEQRVEYDAYGVLLGRRGNRSPGAAPQGLYAAADGWLALSIETDEQWDALATFVATLDNGRPPTGFTMAVAGGAAGRHAHHDAIDEWLAGAVATRTTDELVGALISRGVPAGAVRDPRLMSSHPQHVARGFYESAAHPVAGTHPLPVFPARCASVTGWLRMTAPTVGQHNHEVLAGVAGLTPDEIEALERDAIIGTRPAGV